MRKLRTIELRILNLLLSWETLTPEEIAVKLNVANQSVRNRLVFLKNWALIDHLEYAQYKISKKGRNYLDFTSQSSLDQSSRRNEQ